MSEIARGFLAQDAAHEEPDVGKLIKKLCGEIPVTNYDEERRRYLIDQQTERLKALAETLKK